MTEDALADAPWPMHAMWWHVYPLGFVGAPIRDADPDAPIAHRLDRIEAWLDHVIELGLNGIVLGPIFASSTHGYDTIDHLRIDPRLGDDGDLDRLVAAAHERGIRVVLDGVFNHVGREHPRLEHELSHDVPPDERWFRGEGDGIAVFEGHDALVELDHDSQAVAALVERVMVHWLDRGVDGWRLDAAYAVPPAFWARVLPRVRERHPSAWFLGEVIHGGYGQIVRDSTMDAVTQYELWQGIWHAIADRNLFELAHAIERHGALLETFVPYTFLGNHDVTRIASAIGAELVPHALAVLCTVAGTPSIYAGDELGMTGVKQERVGGDDAVRPAFPEVPPRPEALDEPARRTLETHCELLALRRRHAWLTTARTDVVEVTNASIVLRTATGDAALVTAITLGDEEVRLPVADATHVLAGSGELDAGHVRLPARGWAVLER